WWSRWCPRRRSRDSVVPRSLVRLHHVHRDPATSVFGAPGCGLEQLEDTEAGAGVGERWSALRDRAGEFSEHRGERFLFRERGDLDVTDPVRDERSPATLRPQWARRYRVAPPVRRHGPGGRVHVVPEDGASRAAEESGADLGG